MKRIVTILMALSCAMTVLAQKYVVDAVGNSYAVATTDEFEGKRDFLSQSSHEAAKQTGSSTETTVNIPNGTEVTLRSIGKVFEKKSNKKLKAEISYDGKIWYMWARDLTFSDSNAAGVKDALEGVDFSPRHFKLNYKDSNGEKTYRFINVLDVHSDEGHRLYSYYFPIRVLVLIAATYLLFLFTLIARRSRFIHLLAITIIPLLMIATVAIEGYYIFRLGSDSMWFINPDFFPKKTCVVRSIPLIATFVLQWMTIIFYFRLLPEREGANLHGFTGLVSTLIGFIPAVVAGYFIAKGITGFDDAAATITDATHAWIILGASAFLLLLIYPIIHYTLCINTGNRFTSLLAGTATSLFVVIFWIGMVLLLIMIIFALFKLFLAIIAQIFMWVVMGGFVTSKLGGAALGGGGRGGAPQMVWKDMNGGVHTNEVDARAANERIAASREQNNP